MNTDPVNINSDDMYYEDLETYQGKDSSVFIAGATEAVQ